MINNALLSSIVSKIAVSAITVCVPFIFMSAGIEKDKAIMFTALFAVLPVLINLSINLEYFAARYINPIRFELIPIVSYLMLLTISVSYEINLDSILLLNTSYIISHFQLFSDRLRAFGDYRFVYISIIGYLVGIIPYVSMFFASEFDYHILISFALVLATTLYFASQGGYKNGILNLLKYLRSHLYIISINLFTILLFWFASLGDRFIVTKFNTAQNFNLYDFYLLITISNVLMFSIPIYYSTFIRRGHQSVLVISICIFTISIMLAETYGKALTYFGKIEPITSGLMYVVLYNILLLGLVSVRIILMKANYSGFAVFRCSVVVAVVVCMMLSYLLASNFHTYLIIYAGLIWFVYVLSLQILEKKSNDQIT